MENEKTESRLEFFPFFFVLTAIFKKRRMVAKIKHHIRKKYGPKR